MSKMNLSVDIRILSTKGCLPLPLGYLHAEKRNKMCIKSELKEICLKLATNGRSNKGFLLTSKVCRCPRAINMYKIIKNVYKIRFRRDHFETCNIWAKRTGLSVVIKFLLVVELRLNVPYKIFVPNGTIYM